MAVAPGSVTLSGCSVPLGTVNIPETIIPPSVTLHNSQTADTNGVLFLESQIREIQVLSLTCTVNYFLLHFLSSYSSTSYCHIFPSSSVILPKQ